MRVALFVGGASTERSVSKLSSKSIYESLIELGHEVILIDPAYGNNQPKNPNDFFDEKDLFEVSPSNYLLAVLLPELKLVDIAFIGLHGKWGEDGTMQSLLEMMNIKYVGSDVLASALCMDKMMTKIIFKENGIPVPKGFLVRKNNYSINETIKQISDTLVYPIVVKPNDQGSTFGLSVCQSEVEVDAAMNFSFQFSNATLIEEFIDGRELTVGILNGKSLPVLEIRPKHNLYDYECKYTKGMSEYIVPAPIPRELFEQLQKDAEISFKVTGCKGYARTDFKLRNDGSYICFEINTLPGMTSTSLLPKMAKANGMNFTELIDYLIKISI